MKRAIVAVALLLAGCTVSDNDFSRLMKQEGITDAQATGYQWFSGCKDSDDYNTGFVGVKNGQKIKGTLCGSFSAGYTIRYK